MFTIFLIATIILLGVIARKIIKLQPCPCRAKVYMAPRIGMHENRIYTCMTCKHSWQEPFHGPF